MPPRGNEKWRLTPRHEPYLKVPPRSADDSSSSRADDLDTCGGLALGPAWDDLTSPVVVPLAPPLHSRDATDDQNHRQDAEDQDVEQRFASDLGCASYMPCSFKPRAPRGS